MDGRWQGRDEIPKLDRVTIAVLPAIMARSARCSKPIRRPSPNRWWQFLPAAGGDQPRCPARRPRCLWCDRNSPAHAATSRFAAGDETSTSFLGAWTPDIRDVRRIAVYRASLSARTKRASPTQRTRRDAVRGRCSAEARRKWAGPRNGVGRCGPGAKRAAIDGPR